MTDRGGGCVVIGNDGGGGKEMVRGSGGRSFQRRGAVISVEGDGHCCHRPSSNWEASLRQSQLLLTFFSSPNKNCRLVSPPNTKA